MFLVLLSLLCHLMKEDLPTIEQGLETQSKLDELRNQIFVSWFLAYHVISTLFYVLSSSMVNKLYFI